MPIFYLPPYALYSQRMTQANTMFDSNSNRDKYQVLKGLLITASIEILSKTCI